LNDSASTTAHGNRFPRTHRVIRRGDFQRAYRDGARAKSSTLIVVAVANGLAHPRLGLSVGKACWRGAVQRNRVKRIVREAFRTSQRELPAGFDLIVIPAVPKLVPELAATRAELIAMARKAAQRFEARRKESASG
jgi:ribonuclease P protein component